MKQILLIALLSFQLFASDYIDVYDAYTNGKRVIVEGRVIDVKDKREFTARVVF